LLSPFCGVQKCRALSPASAAEAHLEANAVERLSDAVLPKEHLPMSVIQSLSIVALRQLVGGACSVLGITGAGDKVVDFLTDRFTDHSQKLTTALQTANERAWKALEIALAGNSLWERCKVALARAEDKAFAQQVRTFLDVSPFKSQKDEHVQVFRKALKELRDARSKGLLTEGRLAFLELAREAGTFASFENPQVLLDAEWKVIDQTASELRGCPHLSNVLRARTRSAQNPAILKPSILAVGVRYYFRREVETDEELSRGLTFAKLEALGEAQETGFAALTKALTQQGERLGSSARKTGASAA
jgi:hypothetical protein